MLHRTVRHIVREEILRVYLWGLFRLIRSIPTYRSKYSTEAKYRACRAIIAMLRGQGDLAGLFIISLVNDIEKDEEAGRLNEYDKFDLYWLWDYFCEVEYIVLNWHDLVYGGGWLKGRYAAFKL